jgi:hypothetical protein
VSRAEDDPVISPELREAIEDVLKDIDFDAI